MIYNTVSIRYAKALMDLCNEENLTDAVYNDMREMHYLLFESYELRNFLKTPQIDDKTKSRLIEHIFKSHFQKMTVMFFALLIKKGRSNLVIYIVSHFISMYRKQTGIVSAKIKSAFCMTDDMKQKIIDKLKTATGKTQIELSEQIDQSLLGGFILEYDGKSYDASIKRELVEIHNVFTEK